MVGTISGKDGF